jgi:hypothetical protein
MANVLFISETFLKDNTLLHENIDFKYLRPVVLMCQDIYIQHKIGTTLYDELKTQITNSTFNRLYFIGYKLKHLLRLVTSSLIKDYINKVLRTVQTLRLMRLTSFSISIGTKRNGTRKDWLTSY